MDFMNNLYAKGKDLCDHIFPSKKDYTDCDSPVDNLLQSVNSSNNTIDTVGCESENETPPLYNEPSDDYYSSLLCTKEENKEEIKETNNEVDGITEKTWQEHNNSEYEINNDLMSKLSNLLEELDNLSLKSTDSNVINIIDFCANRIIESMVSCGCELIEHDNVFNSSRHRPSPFTFVQDGSKITKVVKCGLIYKGKVIRKALVNYEK